MKFRLILVLLALLFSCSKPVVRSDSLYFQVVDVQPSRLIDYKYVAILKSNFTVRGNKYFEYFVINTNVKLEKGQFLKLK